MSEKTEVWGIAHQMMPTKKGEGGMKTMKEEEKSKETGEKMIRKRIEMYFVAGGGIERE